jgi:uncharacterized membrane protein
MSTDTLKPPEIEAPGEVGAEPVVSDPPAEAERAEPKRPKMPREKAPTEPVGAGAVAGRVLRTLTVFALVGFSVVFYAQQLRGRWVDKFIASNELDIEARNLLLVTLVLGAVLGALVPGVILLWKRTEKALDQVNQAVRIACPLVLLGAAPAVFRWKPWTDNPIGLGITLLAFSLVLERTLRISFEAVPSRAWDWLRAQHEKVQQRFPRVLAYAPFAFVLLCAISYALFMSYMSVRLHHRLETRAFDLGGYDSLFYNALSGHPFRCPANVMPTGDWSSLKGHAELSIYVLLPIYAISPRAETLLILQSCLLGLASIPLYLVAARHTSKIVAVIVALCYLCFPSLHSANLFDFHMQPVAIFFVLWVAYFIDARRYVWLAIALPIALGLREDISIGLTIGAFFLVFTGYRPVAGLIVALVSSTYFFTMRFVIMPMVGEWWFEAIYKDLFPPGQETYFGVAKTLVTNPVYVLGTLLTQDKLIHTLRIFSPVALMPLRRAHLWWLLIPGAFFTILTTGYKPTVSPTFQYVGHWIPYMFLATALALAAIRKSDGKIRQAAAVIAMAVATLAATYNWGAFIQRNHMVAGWGRVDLSPPTDKDVLRLQQLRELIAVIPRDASVGASETELPHLSNRVDSQTLRYSYDQPDYILFRTGTGKFGSDQGNKELKEKRYVKIDSRGPFILLERADRVKAEAEEEE